MPNPPKPNALKHAQGTYRKDRDANIPPEYKNAVTQAPPITLTGVAAETWTTVFKLLTDSRVLTDADFIALEQYCLTYRNFVMASNLVDEQGIIVTTSKGETKKNPAVTAMTEASRELRGLSGMLGLDPASRTRVSAQPEPEFLDDLWDDVCPPSRDRSNVTRIGNRIVASE